MLFGRKKPEINKGVSFGVTSGVITTLGLIVGLDASTQLKTAVIAGILSIAIADSFSDAMGMHVSEESQHGSSSDYVWKTTLLTLLSKVIVATSFIIPILLYPLDMGVIVCVTWGVLITAYFSYKLAKSRKESIPMVVAEHVGITLFVVMASYFVGRAISNI